MEYYIIPSNKGVDLHPIPLQNCRVEDGDLHADSVCLGVNVDIDSFKIEIDGRILVNDAPIYKPWCGDNPNNRTWLHWSDKGICKV